MPILTGSSLPGGTDASNIAYRAVFDVSISPATQTFYVPIGTYLRADPNDALVEILVGAAWEVFEGDVTFVAKKTVDPSIADLCVGFTIDVPALTAQVRITYCARRLLCEVPTVSAVRVIDQGGGNLALDGSVVWNKSIPEKRTNGALVTCALDPAAADAYLIEVWRKTRRGGFSGPHTSRIRAGARFVPYFRTAIPKDGLFAVDQIQKAMKGQQLSFAFCLYDPATGARTELSRQTLHCYRAARTWVTDCYHRGP